ncbi:hypothetical protein [Rhodopseudomonas palustris]|uniref:hypothetical protein n=1 Tax=Rhodopseudomonas palustris TaxID=1076 RepID=UPI0002F125C2|nr:hypothetical protein [Rhodopseudomonas palustris]
MKSRTPYRTFRDNSKAKAAVYKAIRTIRDQRSRNLVRGAIARNTDSSPSLSINTLRRQADPGDLCLATTLLLGQNGPFPLPQLGGTYRNLIIKHTMLATEPDSEVAFVVGHVNGWADNARRILADMSELARLPQYQPSLAMEALAAFAESYGSSFYILRKTAYLMSRYADDSTLQSAFQRIAKAFNQSAYPEPYFSALQLMETDSSYCSTATTRVRLFQKYVEDDYRQYLPLNELVPTPLSRTDLAALLRRSHSSSLVDELAALAITAHLRSFWPALFDQTIALLDPSIAHLFLEFLSIPFDPSALYSDVARMDADVVYYQRAAAFCEFKDCAIFRRSVDAILVPRLMEDISPPVDTDTSPHFHTKMPDLIKATQGFVSPTDYERVQSCGTFLRTVQFLQFLNTQRNYSPLSAHDFRFICEHTVALDILLCDSEIEMLYASSDDDSRPLITVLALALHKAKSRDDDIDFKFRHSLCNTVITQFNGSLEAFIAWLLPNTPSIADYLLTILDRPTLQKLYWIVRSADEADRTRQSLLRTVGKQRNQIAHLIEADAIEARRQVAKLRKFFDDSRIYVDGPAMKEWLVANPSTYAQQYVKMIEHEFSSLTFLSTSTSGKLVITEWSDLDYVLVEAGKAAFEQFCTNKQFGIESYLGRRIRHNTMSGMMRGGIDDLIESPTYDLLTYDSAFVDANKRWVASYHRTIEHLRKDLLQFRSDAKPLGIFNSTLKRDDNTNLAIASLRNMLLNGRNPLLMNDLLIRFCWQEINPQLQTASRMISIDLVKEATREIEQHFFHFDSDDLQRRYRQQLRALVHERFMRLGSWFRQPEDGFVSARTRQLCELVLVEATDSNLFGTPTVEWSGDALDLEIDGLSVHRMYDCLFVILHNALTHGQENGLITIQVSQEAMAFESVGHLKATVSSRFSSTSDRSKHIARLAESFGYGDPESAMVTEGYSGIKKLRYITRTGDNYSNAGYTIDADTCSVFFTLAVELADLERPDV